MSKPTQFFTWLNTCNKCKNKLIGIEYKDKIIFKCKKCKQVIILRKEI